MGLFTRTENLGGYDDNDAGSGSFNQYGFDRVPRNKRVTMRLADSNPYQDELRRLAAVTELQAFINPRTIEEERTDATIPVRLFADRRMSSVVGFVPRGLESIVLDTISRLDKAGRSTRIPATIISTKHGLRLDLMMGQTR